MKEPGHNYFFAVPKTWKENNMLPPSSILDRLDAIEERLNNIESTFSVLLELQEDYVKQWEHIDDAVHDETA